jgi:iron complex transport system substrate-binding protein
VQRLSKIFITSLFVVSACILPLDAVAADRIVADLLGRRVAVPDDPQRIVAMAPNITEIVFALDQEKKLIGATTYSDYPPAAEDIPRIGSYIHLDLERIVALQPDLCLAIKDGNPKDTVLRLESLGIAVYAVDPRNLESVMETLARLGDLLHADDKAEQVVTDMRKRIDLVDALVAKSPYRPRVFFQIGVAPIVSVGTNTFIHELIERAGGKNLAQGPVPYPRFSREQVIGLLPDIIIITSMARAAVFEEVKAEWSQWNHVPAVKNNRIYIQDSNLFDRPSPRLVNALEVLAELIHPELFHAGTLKEAD